MKIAARNTARRVVTRRITSPTYTKEGDRVKFLLGYVDDQAFQRTLPVSKELFAYAAGDNEEGQLPDGLDRLFDHQFIIHVDKNDKAVGIDVIPARSYRGGVIPVKQADIKTVRLEWLLGGAVCRVAQRPHKVKAAKCIELIKAIDGILQAGKAITLSTKLPGLGKVQSVESDAIEVLLSSGRTAGQTMYELPTGDDDE